MELGTILSPSYDDFRYALSCIRKLEQKVKELEEEIVKLRGLTAVENHKNESGS